MALCRSIFIASLVLVSAFSQAYDIVNDTRGKRSVDRILAFGDSQTAGVSIYSDSYPFQLSKLIGKPVTNLAVNGLTAETAASPGYIEEVLARFPNPDVVMMTLTGNDIQSFRNQGELLRDLETVFQKFQRAGAMVVMLATDINGNAGSFGGWQSFGLRVLYGNYYNELLNTARRNGVLVVPKALEGIWGNDKLLMRVDGGRDPVHPNYDGHNLVANRVADVLIPYLPEVSGKRSAVVSSRKPVQYHEAMGSGPINDCGDASLSGLPVYYFWLTDSCVVRADNAASFLFYWVEVPESALYTLAPSIAGAGEDRYVSIFTGFGPEYVGTVKAPAAGVENFSDRAVDQRVWLEKGWSRIGLKFEQSGIAVRYIDVIK